MKRLGEICLWLAMLTASGLGLSSTSPRIARHDGRSEGTAESSKQSIWIVRYGLTKFPLVENEGPYDSESAS